MNTNIWLAAIASASIGLNLYYALFIVKPLRSKMWTYRHQVRMWERYFDQLFRTDKPEKEAGECPNFDSDI